MDYEQLVSDLPLHRTLVCDSVEENEEIMRRAGVDRRLRQLGRERFRSDTVARSTEQAEFFVTRYNKALGRQRQALVPVQRAEQRGGGRGSGSPLRAGGP